MKKALVLLLGFAALSASRASCSGGGGAPAFVSPTTPITLPTALPTPVMSRVAVLGDSICAGYITTNPLAYIPDASKAWPAVVAQLTGGSITNLCVPGYGVSQAALMVSRIPTDANYVLYACGSNDFGGGVTFDQEHWALDALLASIHTQAPNAKMVFVGVRPWMFTGGFASTIRAFNAYEASLPGIYVDDTSSPEGTGFDVASEWDANDVHPSLAAVQKIAALVAASLH